MEGLSSTSQKGRLLASIDQAGESLSLLRSQTQDILEIAACNQEIVTHLRPIINDAPSDDCMPKERWELLENQMIALDREARQLGTALASATSFSVTSSSTALSTTTATMYVTPWVTQDTKKHLEALENVLARPQLLDEVIAALRRFDLDSAAKHARSPVDLLREAGSVLSRPSGQDLAPASVLIPAREALNAAVAELVRRRTEQEPTGKGWRGKVVSIGGQAAIPNPPLGHFERLGTELDDLMNDLSGAKQRHMTDEKVRRLFDSVLRFFDSLLAALDPARLSRP